MQCFNPPHQLTLLCQHTRPTPSYSTENCPTETTPLIASRKYTRILQMPSSNTKSNRFGSTPYEKLVFITLGRQHSAPRKCCSTLKAAPQHSSHTVPSPALQASKGSWSPYSQNLASHRKHHGSWSSFENLADRKARFVNMKTHKASHSRTCTLI